MIDLSEKNLSPDEIRYLKKHGRYQPYKLPGGIMTGAGLSFYKKTELRTLESGSTHVDASDFVIGAKRQAAMYEDFIDLLVRTLDVSGLTYLDTCCNSGYFPYRLSQLGATATGIDVDDYTRNFEIVNRELGLNTEFIHGNYDMTRHVFDALGERTFDVVSNIAFICHDSDPTFLLHELGNRAKKALLLFSLFPKSDEFFIKFGNTPNKYFGNDFPISFDNGVQLSDSLLRYSLTSMGFNSIIEADRSDSWPFRDFSWRCFLAVR